MPLIGTAGHVDHGKSTLIQKITGRDPDRWAEEKRRGLTIDLGFAWVTLPDGREVSFVDVPGHERYLKNMLAGIEAIDVALFVVAADEGWMPQSEEHLAVLDLLDVERGVIALTKVDAVEAELIEIARAEVTERTAGTTLARAPIHAVSAVTGVGVDDLLEDLFGQIPDEPPWDGRPRLWVDRSFSIPGAGTVVTGSLLGSSLEVDDVVDVLPAGLRGRVRGLQSHERSHDLVSPGRRVAINISGIDHELIRRGDMIGLPGQWELSSRFSVSLRPTRLVDEIDRRGAYGLHIGSAAHRVDLIGIENGVAVFETDNGIPISVGDRFILRDTGRRLVVGGGQVLDPAPGRTRRALATGADADPEAGPDLVAARLLAERGVDSLKRLAAHSGGGSPTQAILAGDRAIDSETFAELTRGAIDLVETEHDAHPLRPGLPMATLAERLGVAAEIAEEVVAQSGQLERRGPSVARSDHHAGLTLEQEAAWEEARARLAESLAVPDEANLDLDAEILHMKLRTGELVRVSPSLVYLPGQIEEIRALLTGLGNDFTVADFRDAAGLSRKYAVPILEWSDREGLTVRRGDLRRLR